MKINIYFSRPRRAFFKIVFGLYEEMEFSDENRALGNWILARNFLKKYFDLYFYAWIVANCKTRLEPWVPS